MLKRALSRAGRGLALFLGACGAAGAGTFDINPVRATLTPAQAVTAITVHNGGDEDTVVQLEVLSWSQQAGKDVYGPTREILATPPIFKLAPGATQIVRVGLRRAPDPQRELTYRLFLQEVPAAPKEGFEGLRVTLRMGIPVFVTPPVAAAASLQWSAVRTPQGQISLGASNGGNAHIQIMNIGVSLSGKELGRLTEPSYVLAGQSRSWPPLPVNAPPGSVLRVVSRTDAGDLSADVVVEERDGKAPGR